MQASRPGVSLRERVTFRALQWSRALRSTIR